MGDIHFPNPVGLGPATKRWRESDLRRYEALLAGEQVAESVGPDVFLTDREVASRYGVARQTIWRWCAKSRDTSYRAT